MTNYEKIRIACNKACPELLELTRGCEVVNKVGDFNVVAHVDGEGVVYTPKALDHDFHWDMIEGIAKILGRPPELRHLFRAIGKNERAGDGFRVMTWWGHFFFEGKRQKTEYDLTKPLHEQSEQTLEFLASLLPNPEKDDN